MHLIFVLSLSIVVLAVLALLMSTSTSTSTSTTTTATQVSRGVSHIAKANEQFDGEGARVRRAMAGSSDRPYISPFLMLDEFMVTKPGGFPDHPHRGFQTVTYMLEGAFRHKDNKGHEGVITPEGVQWMTAGRGIIHSELPETDGLNRGLQLWVNLEAKNKMIEPNYQELSAEQIPEVKTDGVRVKVVAGSCLGVQSPVLTLTPSVFFDIKLDPNVTFTQPVDPSFNGFVYLFEGSGKFGEKDTAGVRGDLLQFDTNGGNCFKMTASSDGCRLALIAGKPINEPVAQYGPFVMNTQEELHQAMMDYQLGRF